MPDKPTISVVMAVYNSAPFLREALASIRWQTFTDWECICVDDGSTDESPSILKDFADSDPRFRIFRQPNSGIVSALTLGEQNARADLIARMDSDDVSLPDRLNKQLRFLIAHPECIAVGANMQIIDPTGAPIDNTNCPRAHKEIEGRYLKLQKDPFSHATILMRHQAVIEAGGHRKEYPWTHDTDLLMRMCTVGRIANLPDALYLYRQHPKNSCTTNKTEVRTELRSLLREQHEVRGLIMPASLDESLAKPKKQSSMVGKWARRAARNGYYQTAWNLWRKQFRQSPVSFETTRITAEMVLRSLSAVIRGKKAKRFELPDWRQWDCRPNTTKKQAAA